MTAEHIAPGFQKRFVPVLWITDSTMHRDMRHFPSLGDVFTIVSHVKSMTSDGLTMFVSGSVGWVVYKEFAARFCKATTLNSRNVLGSIACPGTSTAGGN